MRTTYDHAPLFRSSIGFDRIVELLQKISELEA